MTMQYRRGTEANIDALSGGDAPAAGEPLWCTDTEEVRIGDGSTAGGVPVAGSSKIVNNAKAWAVLDLSGAAQTDVIILHALRACTIVSITALYTEASSADAGVTIKVGKETDDDYYYTGTSEVSKAAWYEFDLTPLNTDIALGDTVIADNAGGKTGTGEILIILEYRVN